MPDDDAHSIFDLSGKIAFVAGGYGGIGSAIAWGFARHGASVVIAGRDAGKAQALAARLVDAGIGAAHGGRQIHLLSVRAQLGLRDRGYSAYCSTKGGVVMLVKQHAMELARHGITVNGIAPTVVRTEMARHWLDNPDTHAQIVARIPLGRVGEPHDVVGAALFFAAPASSFVTGQILYVDGGVTASQ